MSGEIKEQLQSLQDELKSKHDRDHPRSGDLTTLKMGDKLPTAYEDLALGTPRTLSRSLQAEAERARKAQEDLLAKQVEAAEASRRADLAAAEIEIQKRNEEELQHKLMQQ